MAASGLHDKIENQIPSILIVGLAYPKHIYKCFCPFSSRVGLVALILIFCIAHFFN
jgi:hypothetical protein